MNKVPTHSNSINRYECKNEIIEYWRMLWEDICYNFSYNPRGLDFSSPHLLILDIIDEIEFNKLQNPNNIKYFIERCGKNIEKDPVVKMDFKADLILLSEQLKDPVFFDNTRILCKNLLKKFDDGTFFKNNCEQLKKNLTLTDFSDNKKEQLTILSHNIIIELILNGYELKTIQQIQKQILSTYEIIEKKSSDYEKYQMDGDAFEADNGDVIIYTIYPIKTDYNDYKQGESHDEKKYFETVKNEIDSLTIENRIDALKDFFNSNLEAAYFIFEVIGLGGPVDITIGDVNFYSPLLKQYINKENVLGPFDNDKNAEFFHKTSEDHFLNAAIKIQYRDTKYGKKIAIQKINNSLVILRSFISSESPFKLLQNRYLIVKDGKLVQTSREGHLKLWVEPL